ncbi:protein asteroid homolog 1 [Talpa occidentalis]|uniref:protein asteroid homolog 1 n=1 Tax=Talpa occidentalis TaxID=50954 RepID=UPI00188E4019|nr:protein asteroid homolog 1 [Talpa occidentalis]XP_037380318.1 protein asteroid homolog 1 [Talpa occidentalis]XP_037380323.1 protein asteroid homolog 1 [Talpa occidentalis]XP_037380326.1 protein asteroid homolog 1 [Talpa occidentalis]XP_054545321.1 protein asteroid homolog 1 [Talpa occidentalis]XP_054545348.1 protein asteroid homolog 1 [Talpa occidentalis]XP_054545375.1 protein asteroid homolog 1 [Talpa occidentalis]
MGIRGLMSFVEDHGDEFFTDLKLRNTKIVIDGYALFHRLCFSSGLELQYGGDYDSFADVVEKFFESLFACNICPYIVLDGGCDISDKKLTTIKDRAREKIQMAHSLSVGGGGYVCPLLIREVFIQVLSKLRVCFVQCFSEADRDIMTLANHWNCPVLSSDSDFCIFDLKTGFCPFNTFHWRNRNTIKGTQDYYIPAKCFSLDAFCRRFSNISRDLLPLFAVLCGNDYVNLPIMETFFSRVRPPLGATSSKGRRHHRVLGLLNWLSQFSNAAEALENVLKYLPSKNRENVKELLCSSMEEYQQSQVKLQDFFQSGTYACPGALDLGLPEWVLAALAKGQLSPFISDALVLRRTFLHTQVEHMQRPSAHRISQPIRQVIYGLLLSACPCQEALPPQPLVFSEVERINKNIKTSVVAVEFPKDHFDVSNLTELSLASRQMLLTETLKVKRTVLDPIPALLKLPIAVSCYWLQHSEAKAKMHHLQALLLGMLLGPLQAMINSPDKEELQEGGAKKLYEELQRVKQQTRPGTRLDLDTAHIFCQWQSCLQMGLYLNQLLCCPFPEPDLTRLYSGSLVHSLCRQLLASASVESLLSMCSEAQHLYQQLFNATKSHAPAELFLPKGKSSSKKKKPKKQGTSQSKNRVGTTSDTRSWQEESNRFGILMVDNPEDHTDITKLE